MLGFLQTQPSQQVLEVLGMCGCCELGLSYSPKVVNVAQDCGALSGQFLGYQTGNILAV